MLVTTRAAGTTFCLVGILFTVSLIGCNRAADRRAEDVPPTVATGETEASADGRGDDIGVITERAAETAEEPSAAEPEITAEESSPETGVSLGVPLPDDPEPTDPETELAEMGYQSPSEAVKKLLDDPPGAQRLSQQSQLWVDVSNKRVFVDGYVAQQEAYLEMFACPAETKEHESVVGVLAQSSELHAALLAIGATQGKPVQFHPEYKPATGQRIRIWVMWYDEDGEFHTIDARRWVRHSGTGESLDRNWVFAGSYLWKDPEDGKAYYQADSGEMICVSNFETALLDLPVESSAADSDLMFESYSERIPPRGTPLRLMLLPIPEEAEEGTPPRPDFETPPDESLMPRRTPEGRS